MISKIEKPDFQKRHFALKNLFPSQRFGKLTAKWENASRHKNFLINVAYGGKLRSSR
jgi:hypothetical protein